MWRWLRRTFVTGFFVTVPLVVSVVAIVWVFRLGRRPDERARRAAVRPVDVPGLGIAGRPRSSCWRSARSPRTSSAGGCCSAASSCCCTCRSSGRSTRRSSSSSSAFSPDNEVGLQADGARARIRRAGLLLGFLTQGVHGRSRAAGRRRCWPSTCRPIICISATSIVCRPERASFPDMTVEEGIRVFLTGGMGLPDAMRAGGAGRRARAGVGTSASAGRPARLPTSTVTPVAGARQTMNGTNDA